VAETQKQWQQGVEKIQGPTPAMAAIREQSKCCTVASKSSGPQSQRAGIAADTKPILLCQDGLQHSLWEPAIVERAAQLVFRVNNPNAKLCNQENE
jgi:hypothetical protein